MKLNLFLLCLTAAISITEQAVRRDYFLIQLQKDWRQAESYCRNNNKQLASVETADDWYRLSAEAERNGLPVTGWIGLSNNVIYWYWTCSPASVHVQSTEFNWGPGQPDNFGGDEKCVAVDSTGYFADYPCRDLKPSVCFDAVTGAFVAVPHENLSWEQSRQNCISNSLNLACPKTPTQHSEIQNLVLNQGTFWIGVSRPGWVWVAGNWASETLPWRPGYPNNAQLQNNYGFVNNSLVEDKVYSDEFYFFCHKQNTVNRQVIKLKIQVDNVVFDSATQSEILKQIDQRMKERGRLREYSMTWRVRADGKIFHKESKSGE